MFRKWVIDTKTNRIYIYILIYLAGIYGYFELVNRIDHFLSDKSIYLGFGHANLSLLILCLISYLTAVILIVNIIYNKNRSR